MHITKALPSNLTPPLLRPHYLKKTYSNLFGMIFKSFKLPSVNARMWKSIGTYIALSLHNLLPIANKIIKIAYQYLQKTMESAKPEINTQNILLRQHAPPDTHTTSQFSSTKHIQIQGPTLQTLPEKIFIDIALTLDVVELFSLASTSRQLEQAIMNPKLWQIKAERFSLTVYPSDAFSTMKLMLRYFTLATDGSVQLRLSSPSASETINALQAFPEPCWIMFPGSKEYTFHFCFRNSSAEVQYYRDVSTRCRLSSRFITTSKILNDSNFRAIQSN